MKSIKNRIFSRWTTQLLTWLGIGSASMLFVACYGAMPQDYAVVEDGDSIAILMEDSVVMTINKDVNTDVADNTPDDNNDNS